jgi:hypothetical protein
MPPAIDDFVRVSAFGSVDFPVSPAEVISMTSVKNVVELVG